MPDHRARPTFRFLPSIAAAMLLPALAVAALAACAPVADGAPERARLVVPHDVMLAVYDEALGNFAATIEPQHMPVPPDATHEELRLVCGGDYILIWDENSAGHPIPGTVDVDCCNGDC